MAWKNMLKRCHNPKNKMFKYYGARGITVCDRWRFGEKGNGGFVCFYKDLGPKPAGLTLERKSNNLGYSKSNCIWATWSQQMRNKRPVERNSRGQFVSAAKV